MAVDSKERPMEVAHEEFAMSKPEQTNPTGTVTLLEEGEIILIPTPSPDPRGIFNSSCRQNMRTDIPRSPEPP